MSTEDIASQSSVVFVYSMTEKTQLPGFMFPQVVQTLVTRDGIANHYSLVNSLSNISAKKLPKYTNVR